MPGILTLFTSKRTQREITEAQRELHLRKKLVRARGKMLRTHLRAAATSKAALGGAAASGFVLGQISHSRYCKDCGKAHNSLNTKQLLQTGFRIYTLTRTASSLTDLFSHEA